MIVITFCCFSFASFDIPERNKSRKNVMEVDGYKANTEILINADCMEETAFHDYPEQHASYDDHLQ